MSISILLSKLYLQLTDSEQRFSKVASSFRQHSMFTFESETNQKIQQNLKIVNSVRRVFNLP